MISLDLLKPISNVFERGLPVDSFPLPALLEHGTEKALVAVEGLIRKTIAVSNPAFVDIFVFERNHTHHLIVLDLNDQVGASGVVRAD